MFVKHEKTRRQNKGYTLNINDNQHNNVLHNSECHALFIVMLNVILVSVNILTNVILNVVAPFLGAKPPHWKFIVTNHFNVGRLVSSKTLKIEQLGGKL
jgi:hypothetical protein